MRIQAAPAASTKVLLTKSSGSWLVAVHNTLLRRCSIRYTRRPSSDSLKYLAYSCAAMMRLCDVSYDCSDGKVLAL